MDEDRRALAVFRQYVIAASTGIGGTISPSGNVTVAPENDKTFTITPHEGYAIEDVKVDGNSIGAETTHTFTNVTEDHTIAASFARQYVIAASTGIGGTISPSGNVTVAPENDKTFTITPHEGYAIEDVKVDGSSIGAETTHTFTNVTPPPPPPPPRITP